MPIGSTHVFFVEDSWYNGADGASVQATIAEITRIMKV